jgi:hypothetical protein
LILNTLPPFTRDGTVQPVGTTSSSACVWEIVSQCYTYQYTSSDVVSFKITGNQTFNGLYYIPITDVCLPWEECDGLYPGVYPSEVMIINNSFTLNFSHSLQNEYGSAYSIGGPISDKSAINWNYVSPDLWINARPANGYFGIGPFLFIFLVATVVASIIFAFFAFYPGPEKKPETQVDPI